MIIARCDCVAIENVPALIDFCVKVKPKGQVVIIGWYFVIKGSLLLCHDFERIASRKPFILHDRRIKQRTK